MRSEIQSKDHFTLRGSPVWIKTEAGREAFTLIEVLVVLGILGVLFLLLIPIFQNVRTSADRVACQTHLRGLHLAALQMIREQYHFPDWQQWYFSTPKGFREYFMGTSQGLERDSGVMTMATSPLLWRKWKPDSPASHTYAMNYRVSSHSAAIPSWDSIEEPEKMVHFMFGRVGSESSSAPGFFFYTPFLYHLNGVGSIKEERYYDNGYSNIVYADGHVDRISREEGKAMARHNDVESRLFWRGVRE